MISVVSTLHPQVIHTAMVTANHSTSTLTVCAAAEGTGSGSAVCPDVGHVYSSFLGPILAMAERRLVDRTAYVDLIADAIVRQQRASTETI